MSKTESLRKEYAEIKQRMEKILKEHNVTNNELDGLPKEALREFSELNQKLFRINSLLIEELGKKT